jgi:hypothetical protein
MYISYTALIVQSDRTFSSKPFPKAEAAGEAIAQGFYLLTIASTDTATSGNANG